MFWRPGAVEKVMAGLCCGVSVSAEGSRSGGTLAVVVKRTRILMLFRSCASLTGTRRKIWERGM